MSSGNDVLGRVAQPARSAARAWVVAGCWIYAAFFVYGSLVPLNWTPQSVVAALQAFLALPGPQWRAEDRVDVAVNFLLTVPLAFGLCHLALANRARAAQIGWAASIWCLLAVLSLAVEFSQTFFPPRDPSWTDVAAQWVGSAAGIAAHATLGHRFGAWLEGLGLSQPVQARRQRWLFLYLGLMLTFSVMPLDLTLSVGELYRKWRSGAVVLLPFGAASADGFQFAYDLFTDIALWIPVGLLWRLEPRGLSVREVVARTLMVAAGIEFAQLLVLSRVSDITDVLLAAVGGAIGAWLPSRWRGWMAVRPSNPPRRLGAAVCLWLAMAVTLLWAPFNFDLTLATSDRLVEAVSRRPFETYFFRAEFGALNEILRKLLVFLPGGFLLGTWACWRLAGGAWPAGLAGLWLMALVLELGQVLLPGKVADLTDALLGALGAWVGWRMAYALRAQDAQAVPLTSRLVPAAPVAAPSGEGRSSRTAMPLIIQALWTVAALAPLFWVAARLPGLPYNVAKLMPGGLEGVFAAIGLAGAAWWVLGAPLALLTPGRASWRPWLPLLMTSHGLVSFVMLRGTVPLPMLHKIIGTPVLSWPGPLEDMGRFLVLHACVLLPLFGAALLVRAVRRPATSVDLLIWGFWVAVLAWPVHWVLVERAATDNLIELMRGRGSLGTTVALTAAWGALALAGSALSAALLPRRRWALVLLATAALALAPFLFMAGLEPILIKYDRVFSALQFIVSANRSSYATGAELQVRAGAAIAILVSVVAFVQMWAWRAMSVAGMTQPSVRVRPGKGMLAA